MNPNKRPLANDDHVPFALPPPDDRPMLIKSCTFGLKEIVPGNNLQEPCILLPVHAVDYCYVRKIKECDPEASMNFMGRMETRRREKPARCRVLSCLHFVCPGVKYSPFCEEHLVRARHVGICFDCACPLTVTKFWDRPLACVNGVQMYNEWLGQQRINKLLETLHLENEPRRQPLDSDPEDTDDEAEEDEMEAKDKGKERESI
jgi:hypothetical protein